MLAGQLSGLLTHVRGTDLDAPRRPNDTADSPEVEPGTGQIDHVVVKTADRVRIVPAAEIDWIEATGNYVRLHCGAEAHLLRTPLQELIARLDPMHFVRIHRSTVVAVDRIRELREYYRGEYQVILRNGAKLKLSRGRRADLEHRLGQQL